MKDNTWTTTEILRELAVPFWRLEHLVRSGKLKPLNKGRGRERRYSQTEYEMARKLLTEPELREGPTQATIESDRA